MDTKEVPVTTKGSFDHDEKLSPLDPVDTESHEAHEKKAKELRRRVDIRLIPVLTVLYLASYIDRSNSTCSTIVRRMSI